ncbi:hypothetical protein ILYODFUR_028307 [Ilyodon furcidens]|uniref:Uncharacterized protein n=1 Tax=Ilyodon furcidens TaxID=33524 RepID=A0ABV0TE97_9TELE
MVLAVLRIGFETLLNCGRSEQLQKHFKTVSFSSVQNGENMRNSCSRLTNTRRKTHLLGNTSVGISPAPECRQSLRSVYEFSDLVVSDRFPAFKLFWEWPCMLGGVVADDGPTSLYKLKKKQKSYRTICI